jgi:hypothetical protein
LPMRSEVTRKELEERRRRRDLLLDFLSQAPPSSLSTFSSLVAYLLWILLLSVVRFTVIFSVCVWVWEKRRERVRSNRTGTETLYFLCMSNLKIFWRKRRNSTPKTTDGTNGQLHRPSEFSSSSSLSHTHTLSLSLSLHVCLSKTTSCRATSGKGKEREGFSSISKK